MRAPPISAATRGLLHKPDPGLGGFDRIYRVLGMDFRVVPDDPRAGREVDRLLAPFRAELGPVPPRQTFVLRSRGASDPDRRLYRASRRLLRTPTWARTLNELIGAINEMALAEFDQLAIHAGVVAAGARAIAFPAPSGRGKSTLTAACVRAGFQYVSDEALCLDLETGRVIPYPKPIRLSAWSRERLGIPERAAPFSANGREAVIPPADLGRVATRPLHLDSVVLAQQGGTRARLVEMNRAEVALLLLRYSFNHYRRPDAAFRVVTRLAASCRGWRMTYADPIQAARLLRRRFSS